MRVEIRGRGHSNLSTRRYYGVLEGKVAEIRHL